MMTRERERRPALLVMGAGAWGTALAMSFARAGQQVYLWGRDGARLRAMAETRENTRYLPGIPLPECVIPTDRLDTLPHLTTVVLATPLQTTRAMMELALLHGFRQFKGASLTQSRSCKNVGRIANPSVKYRCQTKKDKSSRQCHVNSMSVRTAA